MPCLHRGNPKQREVGEDVPAEHCAHRAAPTLGTPSAAHPAQRTAVLDAAAHTPAAQHTAAHGTAHRRHGGHAHTQPAHRLTPGTGPTQVVSTQTGDARTHARTPRALCTTSLLLHGTPPHGTRPRHSTPAQQHRQHNRAQARTHAHTLPPTRTHTPCVTQTTHPQDQHSTHTARTHTPHPQHAAPHTAAAPHAVMPTATPRHPTLRARRTAPWPSVAQPAHTPPHAHGRPPTRSLSIKP